jgi:5-methylcytosine-specific restriction endonuclease McrA
MNPETKGRTNAKAKAKAKVKVKAKAKAKAILQPKGKTKTTDENKPETAATRSSVTRQKMKEIQVPSSKTYPLVKGHIPKKVRTDVWNTFIGPNIPIHKCLCCLKTTICMTDFQVGHVLSEHDGGNLNIDNLRPICASCNISMGTTNMKDYVIKYGYLI